eukprot:3160596-Amphidinium_carterae.1
MDEEVGHRQHRSHASAGECSSETVDVNLELQKLLCGLPEAALRKHSREAVASDIEVGHGQHRSQASMGKSSRET